MYIKEAAIEMEINLSKKEKRLKHQELIELYYSVIVCKMVTQTQNICTNYTSVKVKGLGAYQRV